MTTPENVEQIQTTLEGKNPRKSAGWQVTERSNSETAIETRPPLFIHLQSAVSAKIEKKRGSGIQRSATENR